MKDKFSFEKSSSEEKNEGQKNTDKTDGGGEYFLDLISISLFM